MASINLAKELLIDTKNPFGQQLRDYFEVRPIPVTSRISYDTYPSQAMMQAINETVPMRDSNFFDNVLHAISFYIGDNEIYIAYQTNAVAPYLSMFSYNDVFRAQHRPFIQRTIISATATKAVNIQRMNGFFQNISLTSS